MLGDSSPNRIVVSRLVVRRSVESVCVSIGAAGQIRTVVVSEIVCDDLGAHRARYGCFPPISWEVRLIDSTSPREVTEAVNCSFSPSSVT